MARETPSLPYLSNEDRLNVYNLIITGCQHLWSKGKLQEDKALPLIEHLVKLGQTDPYFLAHLTAWAAKQHSKDLQVTTIYTNALNSADGMPFSAGSKYKKPNLRYVSSAVLQESDPKQVSRVRELAGLKYSVSEVLNEGTHFPTNLQTAIKRYLKFREVNLKVLRGIKKAGLGTIYKKLYRLTHIAPSDEVASILRWKQKDKDIKFEESVFKFDGLSDLEIAEKIRKDKLPVLSVVGALKKISPAIAVALLEQTTGNQAVILRSLFEEQGVLNDPEIKKLYEEKIKGAKTALDRAETISKTASEGVKEMFKTARSEVRKEQLGDVGKVFLHVDFSPSMEGAIEFAKENGSIIAEMIKDPEKNFSWGRFAERGGLFPLPKTFEKDAFAAVLFGRRMGGGTDCFALYPESRKFGAEVDVYISDGEHNMGDLTGKIKHYHETNPNVPKPKAIVLIRVQGHGPSAGSPRSIEDACAANGIPYAEMKPETLHDSALVTQAVREAIRGPMAVIEAINNTDLPKLPGWYFTI